VNERLSDSHSYTFDVLISMKLPVQEIVRSDHSHSHLLQTQRLKQITLSEVPESSSILHLDTPSIQPSSSTISTSSCPSRKRNNHPLDMGLLILQRRPMRHQPLTPPVNHTFLRHQIDVRRDGPPTLQCGLDPALEISWHGWSVLAQDFEYVVTNQVEVLLGVEAEHVDDAGGVEGDIEGGVGED